MQTHSRFFTDTNYFPVFVSIKHSGSESLHVPFNTTATTLVLEALTAAVEAHSTNFDPFKFGLDKLTHITTVSNRDRRYASQKRFLG